MIKWRKDIRLDDDDRIMLEEDIYSLDDDVDRFIILDYDSKKDMLLLLHENYDESDWYEAGRCYIIFGEK